MKVKRSNQKGFTLIELMVVIVILGLLAGILMPKFLGRTEQARRTKATVQIRNIESALRLFKLDNGFYPSTEQGLEALISEPTVGEIPKHWKEGGYMEKGKVPLDPWKNPFQYISPGINNFDYDLSSLGADEEVGGEGRYADINSWEIE